MNPSITADNDNARYISDLIRLMPVVADAIATAISDGKTDDAAIAIAINRLHVVDPVLPIRQSRVLR